jgi:hypothetical protein
VFLKRCRGSRKTYLVLAINKYSYSEKKLIVKSVKALNLLLREVDELETILMERLYNDDQNAHSQLADCINKTNIVFKQIGCELNDMGGYELMLFVYYKVKLNRPVSLISMAWDGVGEWSD